MASGRTEIKSRSVEVLCTLAKYRGPLYSCKLKLETDLGSEEIWGEDGFENAKNALGDPDKELLLDSLVKLSADG
jgi:hypothetical protein